MHGAVPLLQDFLLWSAARRPDHVALVCGDVRVTYREMDRTSNALAHALVARGVARGDRVLVFQDNTVEAAVSFWAVLKAGAVVSMVNPQTKADKLAYMLEDCRPTALLTETSLARVWAAPAKASPHLRTVVVAGGADPEAGGLSFEDALAEGDPETPPPRRNIDIDLAAIVYTSGSTGSPKGVMLTHRNMLTAATSVGTYLELREDDVILGVLPLAFDYGLYQMIMAFRWGARLVLERSFAYPARALGVMEREGVTGFPGVPTIFALLGAMDLTEYDLSKVRFVTNTAAALPQKHIDMLCRVFPQARIYSMYGLTECKRCTYLPPEDLATKPRSVGLAIPDTELWLVDDDDRVLGPNQVGQLVIRGATVMAGYWEKPEATAKRLRPGRLPGERVLYTGDLCRLDEDGYLYFVGRMDDIIKSRGEKVAPKEIENVLMNAPQIREAAVIGVADELLGQAIKAFVVLERGADMTERDVIKHCAAHLEAFMVPKTVELVPELPKTATGKIKKTELS
ncbi:MAG: acyl--CoA ligase [Myxococcales bacterium]|nr:acyl--CoA ligase [Myxococcales bacterium]